MNRFYAERFFSLSRLLQQLSFVQPDQGNVTATEETRAGVKSLLAAIRADCQSVGLRLSVKQVGRVTDALNLATTTVGHLASGLADLQNRIADEIEDSLFVQIPPGKSAFLNDTTITDSLGAVLSDGAFDLDEASKCLAFGRNTAAAFHLMRLIELCLTVRLSFRCVTRIEDQLGADHPDSRQCTEGLYRTRQGSICPSTNTVHLFEKCMAESNDARWAFV